MMGVRPGDSDSEEMEPESVLIELQEALSVLDQRLDEANNVYLDARDDADSSGRDINAQRRIAAIWALDGICQFLATVYPEFGSRRVLLELQSALLDMDQGIKNPLLKFEQSGRGQTHTYSRSIVIGEACAAVEFLIEAGKSQTQAFQYVASKLGRMGARTVGFRGTSADTVKKWFGEIPGRVIDKQDQSDLANPRTTAKRRYTHALKLAKEQLPDGTPQQRADWLINSQIRAHVGDV